MKEEDISSAQTNAPVLISAEPLKEFCTQILQKVGLPEPDADLTADNLLFANLRGTDTHGVSRLSIYIQLIEGKVVNTTPDLTIIKDNGASLLVDADNALGQVCGGFAMKLAIERAKKSGISWVGVRNSGHLGALAYWAMMALPHGMIGICTTSTPSLLAPWGGKEPGVGNNPFAIAIPTGKEMPLVLDMALSIVARGNLFLAAKEGKKIPEGWAIDKNGRPTQDPNAALEGSVLPIGTYKGAGIAMMIDVLCGVLTGSAYGRDIGSVIPPDLSKPLGFGHVMMAIPVNGFIPMDEFTSRLNQYVDQLKQSPPADGFDEIVIPNEKEFYTEINRKKQGIPLTRTNVDELCRLAEKYRVPSPF